MKKFNRKPKEVEAIYYDGKNWEEIGEVLGNARISRFDRFEEPHWSRDIFFIGIDKHYVAPREYLVKIDGNFMGMTKRDFEKMYEEVLP